MNVIRVRCFFALIVGWLLAHGPALAVELRQGPRVLPTSTNAIIRWSTDTSAGGRVHFGTSVNQMAQRISTGAVGTEHEATMSGLKAGTTYWYSVGTARVPLATNSFTTPGVGEVRAKTPAEVPPVVATAPRKDSAAKATAAASGVAFDPTQLKVPPARQTWGAPRTLPDHFERHGADFGAKSADDYAAQAWTFLRRAKAEGWPAKIDADGVLRVYDPTSRAFASYNQNLTTKTYFKPGRRDYFEDQPGRPVDLKKLVP